MIPLVDLKKQYRKIEGQIDKAIKSVLVQGDFILGDEVEKFEQEFADYLKINYCVGTASGSDAILISLYALGVGRGDEVISQANTFISTVFPIIALGAKPILVDVNPDTYQMDTEALKKAITKKTKVIIPVHLFGIPAPMNKIMEIAGKNNIFVLEDACQAHGSLYKGKKCGTYGKINAFSFYPGKNLGAAGDAGAIATNDRDLADRIRAIRNIGQYKKYHHDIFGYNSRLDSLQASILRVKLKHLDRWNRQRRKLADLYTKFLYRLSVSLPPKLPEDCLENFHLYVIRVKNRDGLLEYLKNKGVFCGIHYPIPLHLQKSLETLNYHKGDFPVTEKLAKEILSLPIYPELSPKEIKLICSKIKGFFHK